MPSLQIEAKYKGETVQIFKKYVQIRYENVPEEVLRDGLVQVTGKRGSFHIIPKKSTEFTAEKLPHRYYTTDGKTFTIFTRHFSVFRFSCRDHGDIEKNVTLEAKLYQKLTECDDGKKLVDVKVFVLTVSQMLASLTLVGTWARLLE